MKRIFYFIIITLFTLPILGNCQDSGIKVGIEVIDTPHPSIPKSDPCLTVGDSIVNIKFQYLPTNVISGIYNCRLRVLDFYSKNPLIIFTQNGQTTNIQINGSISPGLVIQAPDILFNRQGRSRVLLEITYFEFDFGDSFIEVAKREQVVDFCKNVEPTDNYERLKTNSLAPIVNLFPNPLKEKLHIQIEQPYDIAQIKIFTITGAEIFSKSFKGSKGIVIDLNHLKNGIYNTFIVLDNKTKKSVIITKE